MLSYVGYSVRRIQVKNLYCDYNIIFSCYVNFLGYVMKFLCCKFIVFLEIQGFNGEGGGKENGSKKNEKKEGEGEGKEKGEGKNWEFFLYRVFFN